MTAEEKKKPLNKSQLIAALAAETGIDKKDVKSLLEAIPVVVSSQMKPEESQQFTFPNLFKIVVKNVPAKPEREVRNPRTGEMMMAKAKPATQKIQVRPLKQLKDMVN